MKQNKVMDMRIEYAPFPNIEFEYCNHVCKGTIRFINHRLGKNGFYDKYWPVNLFGEYCGTQYECGTACCCMALSYIGTNVSPDVLLRTNNGLSCWDCWGTKYIGWVPGNVMTPDLIDKTMSDYLNGKGSYSPVMVHLLKGTWSELGHYILLIGKKSEKEYIALDPAQSGDTALIELTIEGLTVTCSNVSKVHCPIDEIHQWWVEENGYAADTVCPSDSDITDSSTFSGTGYGNMEFLRDRNLNTFLTSDEYTIINIENHEEIGGMYLVFDKEYGNYDIINRDTGCSVSAGQNEFLHDYLNLTKLFGSASHSVSICFHHGPVRLSQIRVFKQGSVPDYVQIWEAPLEARADMALFSCHGDDDQLFYAGLLPLYAGERKCSVQVIYLTDHRNLTNERVHEMLNGLWNVGVRAYPIFGRFADFYSEDLKNTYEYYEKLENTAEELLEFVVTQIRRFRPKVAVGHDLYGEYGHGMHMLYADLLVKALDISADPDVFPESTAQYGCWSIQKTYLHLYEGNKIQMNYDEPLKSFDGLTAFQVSQRKGYPCHRSQQWTWFTAWINGKEKPITKASQIEKYSPCSFGLFRTTVGADNDMNDMLENIIPYAKTSD